MFYAFKQEEINKEKEKLFKEAIQLNNVDPNLNYEYLKYLKDESINPELINILIKSLTLSHLC